MRTRLSIITRNNDGRDRVARSTYSHSENAVYSCHPSDCKIPIILPATSTYSLKNRQFLQDNSRSLCLDEIICDL
jgi:hypothetical protein